MKTSFFTFLIAGFVVVACAQNPAPPQQVQSSFSKKFTETKKVKWELEDSVWEAEFKMNGAKMSASFDMEGTWLETEVEIKKKDLPTMVTDVISAKYVDYKIEEAEKVEKTDFTGYEILVEKGDKEFSVLVSNSGEIVKETEETDLDEHAD